MCLRLWSAPYISILYHPTLQNDMNSTFKLHPFLFQDQRSTVISLQNLIVREVANEERGQLLVFVSPQ